MPIGPFSSGCSATVGGGRPVITYSDLETVFSTLWDYPLADRDGCGITQNEVKQCQQHIIDFFAGKGIEFRFDNPAEFEDPEALIDDIEAIQATIPDPIKIIPRP